MSTRNKVGLRNIWGGLVVAAALPASLLIVGCDDKGKDKADDTTAAPADSAVAAATPDIDVDPPAPVVAEDPAIPLHEAVVGSAPVDADYHATAAPPELIVEDQPAKPRASDIWIPGYWWWSTPLSRYVWITGAWRNPPPEQTWTPGSWVATVPGQWAWSPGYWAPHGFARESAVIDVAPPPVRAEVISARPDPLFYWTPGYYAYRDRAYVWVGGSWMRPPLVGLGWIEPRYVGFGPHFFFQPGRWDYAAGVRGTVYLPNIDVHVGGHFTPSPVPAAVVSAHAGYVSASASAISHGATRTASGGYHASGSAHGGAAAKGSTHGGSEHGGSKEPGKEPSKEPGKEPSKEPGKEPTEPTHGGTEPTHGGTEPTHGGTEPSKGKEPTPSKGEPSSASHLGGSAPPAHGGGTPPAHGGAPPSHGGGHGKEK